MMTSQSRVPEHEKGSARRTRSYEAPTIAVIGPLSKITLGSGGDKNDGINKLQIKN